MTKNERTDAQVDLATQTAPSNQQVCEVPLENKHVALIDYLFLVRHPWSAPIVRCPVSPIRCDVYREEFQFELTKVNFGLFGGKLPALGWTAAIVLKKPVKESSASQGLSEWYFPHINGPIGDYHSTPTNVTDATLYISTGAAGGATNTSTFCTVPVALNGTGPMTGFFRNLTWSTSSPNSGSARLLRTIAYGVRFTLLGNSEKRQGRVTMMEVPAHDWYPYSSSGSYGTYMYPFHEQIEPPVGLGGNAARFPSTRVYSLAGSPNEFHWNWHPTVKADLQWLSTNHIGTNVFSDEGLKWAGGQYILNPANQMDGCVIFSQLDADERILVELTHVYECSDCFIPGDGIAHVHENVLHATANAQMSYEKKQASHVGHAGAHDTSKHAVNAVM